MMNEMMTRDEMIKMHDAMIAEALAKHGEMFLNMVRVAYPEASPSRLEFLRDQAVRAFVGAKLAK